MMCFFIQPVLLSFIRLLHVKKKKKGIALIIIETTIAIISFDQIINKDIYQYLTNLFYIFK